MTTQVTPAGGYLPGSSRTPIEAVPTVAKRTCEVPGCTNSHNARGLCMTHKYRMRKYGTVDLPPYSERPRAVVPLVERFWSNVEPASLDDCWLWRGSINDRGYGLFSDFSAGRHAPVRHRAHRWAYEALIGPIPDGLVLDHLCRVRHCINPWHLDPVTPRVNVLRGDTFAAAKAAQTRCIHGHPFDDENTLVRRDGRRGCRACGRERVQRDRRPATQ